MENRVLTRMLLPLSILVVLAFASTASAQLLAAKDGPIVYGHHHLNTTNMACAVWLPAEMQVHGRFLPVLPKTTSH